MTERGRLVRVFRLLGFARTRRPRSFLNPPRIPKGASPHEIDLPIAHWLPRTQRIYFTGALHDHHTSTLRKIYGCPRPPSVAGESPGCLAHFFAAAADEAKVSLRQLQTDGALAGAS